MEQIEIDSVPGKRRVTGQTREVVIALDRKIWAFARHWLLYFNLFVFAYVGLPFLAPVLMRAGLTTPANVVYTVYTGIAPDDFWAARAFTGNPQMGYKVAFCERDVAIYAAILLGGLIYGLPFVRRRLRPMHWVAWGLIGIAPIALDGFSQLFSNYPYNTLAIFSWLPSRESTPLLRTLTGGVFGLCNAWLASPYVEESMREVRQELEVKLARVDAQSKG